MDDGGGPRCPMKFEEKANSMQTPPENLGMHRTGPQTAVATGNGSESSQNAFCFSAILAAELAEVRKRRDSLERDLTTKSASHPGTAESQGLYPTRRPEPEELKVRFKPIAKPEMGAQTSAQSGEQDKTPIRLANEANLLGLALSGGGIRSATFNLGVLHALAKRKLLHRFDYLSTISGGGYIGAWLTAWIHRRGMREVETCLGAERKDQPLFKEPPEIGFLREYSNYLTPRKGFLGADTWTAIAIYLRNLLLNLSVLILFIAAILLVPRVVTAFAEKLPSDVVNHPLVFGIGISLIISALAVFAIFKNMQNYTIDLIPDRVLARTLQSAQNVTQLRVKLIRSDTPHKFSRLLGSHPRIEIWDPSIIVRKNAGERCQLADFTPNDSTASLARDGTMTFSDPVSAEAGDLIVAVYPRTAQSAQILSFIALPIFIGSVILSGLLVRYGRYSSGSFWTDLRSPWWWVVSCGVLFEALWLLAFVLLGRNLDKPEQSVARKILSAVFAPTSPLIAGAAGGWLLWKVTPILQDWAKDPAGMWNVLGFGAPMISLILLVFTVIQVGLLGVVFAEPRREWWGRVAGVLLIVCFVWAAVFALAGHSPLLLLRLFNYPKSTWLAALGWAASTGLGVIGGKSAKAGALDSRTWKDAVLSVTPYIFIVGLLMLVSLGIHAALTRSATKPVSESVTREVTIQISGPNQLSLVQPGNTTVQFNVWQKQATSISSDTYWKDVQTSLTARVYYALAICLAAAFLLALRVDLNEFSMHYLYRNRLVRCYLGASHRERVPNPFTGFDVNDDIHLADLVADNFYTGPIPIFGAALNLVHGQDLAWQERKAESFAMTPHFCGFDVWFEQFSRPGQPINPSLEPSGYRPTRDYAYRDGFYIGTAMAISGAAASPNMGYHSSPALSFLMTVFNVRLGWWVGNPRRRDTWRNAGPLLGLGYLLAELFGATDDSGRYVYLSDGGHFENLGIYELVKRRCRFILASDADADKDLTFGDLASAIRKCRSDMGIEIQLRTDKILTSGSPPYSKWHCAIADVLYEKSDPVARNGILVYIKTSLTSDESVDVLNYKSEYRDFPHQSTADQWFTESQFESYRALGQHVIETVLCGLPPGTPSELDKIPPDELFKALAAFWKNPQHIQTNLQPDTGP